MRLWCYNRVGQKTNSDLAVADVALELYMTFLHPQNRLFQIDRNILEHIIQCRVLILLIEKRDIVSFMSLQVAWGPVCILTFYASQTVACLHKL